jgi:hypothetical protein
MIKRQYSRIKADKPHVSAEIEMFIHMITTVPDLVLLSLDSRRVCNLQLVNRAMAECVTKSGQYQRMKKKALGMLVLRDEPKTVLIRSAGAITVHGHLCIPPDEEDVEYLRNFDPVRSTFRHVRCSSPEWVAAFTDKRFEDETKDVDFDIDHHHSRFRGPGNTCRFVIARFFYLSKLRWFRFIVARSIYLNKIRGIRNTHATV